MNNGVVSDALNFHFFECHCQVFNIYDLNGIFRDIFLIHVFFFFLLIEQNKTNSHNLVDSITICRRHENLITLILHGKF